jgi:hypothetical protein
MAGDGESETWCKARDTLFDAVSALEAAAEGE